MEKINYGQVIRSYCHSGSGETKIKNKFIEKYLENPDEHGRPEIDLDEDDTKKNTAVAKTEDEKAEAEDKKEQAEDAANDLRE